MKLRRIVHKLMFYYKIVNNHVPNYLKELLIRFYSDSSEYRERQFKNSFFPPATNLWNGLDTSVHDLQSVACFKKALPVIFNFPTSPTLYNFFIDRYSSICHTRIRLDACLLNYHLFRIGCNHLQNVLVVSRLKLNVAAIRLNLLSSAAHIFADE